MTNLVENLLSLARADGGAESLSLIPIHVTSLFQKLEYIWRKIMELALIDFRVDMEADDLEVLGDPSSLARLLSILLENASKFTPAGGLVTISAIGSGKSVVLSVRDTGIGIDAEDLPQIFNRFYRAARPDAPIPRGSGLGLALGKWIAERHGTLLSVDSAPGQGSCFSFVLDRPLELAAASSVLTASLVDNPQ